MVGLTAGTVALAIGLALFQPWKLVIDDVVDEAAPAALTDLDATPAPTGTARPDQSGSARSGAGRPGGQDGAGSGTAGTTGSPAPAVARVLAAGDFISHEHDTTGRARVVALPDGQRVLRIDDLDTSNGPDLRVWLSDAPVVAGRGGWFVFDDGDHVELGRLKGNRGSQNYVVPPSVDLARLPSLTIWCDRFNVSFGAAALTA